MITDKLVKLEEMINECIVRINRFDTMLSRKAVYRKIPEVSDNISRHIVDLQRALPRLRIAFDRELERIKFKPKKFTILDEIICDNCGWTGGILDLISPDGLGEDRYIDCCPKCESNKIQEIGE